MSKDSTIVSLYEGLQIEVNYYFNEGQEGNWGYSIDDSIEPVPASVEEVQILGVIEGELDELCAYITDTPDFYEELEERILQTTK